MEHFELLIFYFLSLTGAIIFAAIYIPIAIKHEKYKNFVEKYSVGINKLKEINQQTHFISIDNYTFEKSYDNENLYREISCTDYLTYQLDKKQNKIEKSLKDSLYNKNLYFKYIKTINSECVLNEYTSTDFPTDKEKLAIIEKKLFYSMVFNKPTPFNIVVILTLTNIKGDEKESKSKRYTPEELKDIINKLNQKQGNFYLNNDVWNSLVKVERGNVSNKVRFIIYQRDGYKCRNCGKKTDDLEIDHIIPISKGGKSTLDNLQTLCHNCNVKKGNSIK